MDLIKLKYFIAAAELLNFSKAAEACNITQTAIGKYINKLEMKSDALYSIELIRASA